MLFLLCVWDGQVYWSCRLLLGLIQQNTCSGIALSLGGLLQCQLSVYIQTSIIILSLHNVHLYSCFNFFVIAKYLLACDLLCVKQSQNFLSLKSKLSLT